VNTCIIWKTHYPDEEAERKDKNKKRTLHDKSGEKGEMKRRIDNQSK